MASSVRKPCARRRSFPDDRVEVGAPLSCWSRPRAARLRQKNADPLAAGRPGARVRQARPGLGELVRALRGDQRVPRTRSHAKPATPGFASNRASVPACAQPSNPHRPIGRPPVIQKLGLDPGLFGHRATLSPFSRRSTVRCLNSLENTRSFVSTWFLLKPCHPIKSVSVNGRTPLLGGKSSLFGRVGYFAGRAQNHWTFLDGFSEKGPR